MSGTVRTMTTLRRLTLTIALVAGLSPLGVGLAGAATHHPVHHRPVHHRPIHRPVRHHPTAAPAPVATTTPTTSPVTATPLPVTSNPAVNVTPVLDYLQSGACTYTTSGWSCDNPCVTATLAWPTIDNTGGCTNALLMDINHARALEGVRPMVLPSNWYTLTPAEQLFVVADLERVDRGLPPYLGLNGQLSRAAQSAAAQFSDPSSASGFAGSAVAGAWGSGFSVLAVDYAWMYSDGWGGSANSTSNVDCTSATAEGCWAHRDELLGVPCAFNPGIGLHATNVEMGASVEVVDGSGSYVDLLETPNGASPAMTFTWANDVLPYLGH